MPVAKSPLRASRRAPCGAALSRRHTKGRFTPLLAERLEDRTLLAAVMTYELHLLPPGGTLAGPRITSVNVGESYDLAVTVKDLRANGPPGTFAGYLDIGYDSSKTQARVEALQRLSIGSFSTANPHTNASGTFTLAFGGQTTGSIAYSSDAVALAATIQTALTSLTSIGAGNVRVTAEAPVVTSSYSIKFDVRFGSVFEGQDVTSLTIPTKSLSGANITVEDRSDLVLGGAAVAFTEAFRAPGQYQNALFAENLPNLINDVGAFAGINWLDNRQLELVRAQLKATAAGTVTFAPSVADLLMPAHETLMHARPGESSRVLLADIVLGPAQTLTINVAIPVTANPDSATVAEDAAATTIDVLANDTTQPVGGTKEVTSITQPASGSVTFTATGVSYTPAANFVGTDSFTYAVRNTSAGATSATATATVTIAVTPVNDAPLLDAIADPPAILEDAAAQIINLAGILAGPGETQTLTVTAVSSNPGLIPHPLATHSPGSGPFDVGSLSYQPVANQSGTATITVTVTDDGGTAAGGVNTFSRTFVVNVTAVNDRPSFVVGLNQTVTDDADFVIIPNWATSISAGPANEASQGLTFEINTDKPELFYVEPFVDSLGELSYLSAYNISGIATVTIVLRDDGGTAGGGSDASQPQTFTIEVTQPFRWRNSEFPVNVDGSTEDSPVSALDAVLVINYLNGVGGGAVPDAAPAGPPYLDVDGDNFVAPIDAALVINYLNDPGESSPSDDFSSAEAPVAAAIEASDDSENAARFSHDAFFAAAADWFTPTIRRRRGR